MALKSDQGAGGATNATAAAKKVRQPRKGLGDIASSCALHLLL